MGNEWLYKGNRQLTLADGRTLTDQEDVDSYLTDWENRNRKEIRLQRVRSAIQGITLTPDMLVEEKQLIKEGELLFLDEVEDERKRNTQPIFRELDIFLHNGTDEDLFKPDYTGISQRYILYINNQDLFIDLFAPTDCQDLRQFAIDKLHEFMTGKLDNLKWI